MLGLLRFGSPTVSKALCSSFCSQFKPAVGLKVATPNFHYSSKITWNCSPLHWVFITFLTPSLEKHCAVFVWAYIIMPKAHQPDEQCQSLKTSSLSHAFRRGMRKYPSSSRRCTGCSNGLGQRLFWQGSGKDWFRRLNNLNMFLNSVSWML
jgi:hypothetical protein